MNERGNLLFIRDPARARPAQRNNKKEPKRKMAGRNMSQSGHKNLVHEIEINLFGGERNGECESQGRDARRHPHVFVHAIAIHRTDLRCR